MTQVFIDTIVMCSITGLAIVLAGQYDSGLHGSELTTASFNSFLGPAGSYVVAISLLFFASSTIIGWSYYGEKCCSYLFSKKIIPYYRALFVLAVFVGAVTSLEIVWTFADIMNGLMALPNLIGILALSGVVAAETRVILKKIKDEKDIV